MVMVLPVVGSGRRLTMASVSRFRSVTGNLRTRPMPVTLTACRVWGCTGRVPTLQREMPMWRAFFFRLLGECRRGEGFRNAPGSNYESGGQEFESLRARHEINDLAHHDLPEKAPG